jgi:hypothetical protein
MQNGGIPNSGTFKSSKVSDIPFDEREPVYFSNGVKGKQTADENEASLRSKLEYSCISELGAGFKGMLGRSEPF